MIGLPPFAPDLTVQEHVELVAATWFGGSAARALALRYMTALGVHSLEGRFPHELSSGQRQLFALTLALARPFRILLLDEPEQRLDQDRLRGVADVLYGLREGGATIVLATHSHFLARQLHARELNLDASQ